MVPWTWFPKQVQSEVDRARVRSARQRGLLGDFLPRCQVGLHSLPPFTRSYRSVLCVNSRPVGFADTAHPDDICVLSRSLYGLKQASRAWCHHIVVFLGILGFRATTSNTLLFMLHHGDHVAYLLLYVDDIVIIASHAALLHDVIA